MYEPFFGLTAKPFDLVPNPEFFFESSTHRKARNFMKFGIYRGVGFIMLTGEVGTGKTTLVRDVMRSLGGQYTISVVFYTCAEPVQILQMINRDFGIEAASKDKVELIAHLNDFLIGQCAQNRKSVILIDEAQNLSLESLEEIRLLSNLEANTEKLLQIILIGQPELREKLAQPCLRQLRQRVAVQFHLAKLTEEETAEYVLHRLELAGNRKAVAFTPSAFAALHELTNGTPRLINICCDYVMLSAFSDQTSEITEEMVRTVAGELSIATPPPSQTAPTQASETPAGGERVWERLTVHERHMFEMKKYFVGKLKKLDQRLEKIEAGPALTKPWG